MDRSLFDPEQYITGQGNQKLCRCVIITRTIKIFVNKKN